MKGISLLAIVSIMTIAISACCSSKKAGNMQESRNAFIPGPKVIIYKTIEDYSKLVPVALSEDGTTLVSYPDIKDVFYEGKPAYPTQLHGGFLLDNRGINANVAFISLTYDEYSKLAKTPSPDYLMSLISNKKPLLSMYACGLKSGYKDLVNEINSKIDAGDFSGFIKLK